MTGIDWNAAAKQIGIYDASQLKNTNATGTAPQGVVASAPSFQGGLQLPPQLTYDQYQPQKSSGSGVTTAIGLLATVGTIAYFARRGKIFKHGKFGGSIGDWIRNIGKKGKDGLTNAQVRHLRDIQAKKIKEAKSVLRDKEATAEAKKAAQKAIKDARTEGAKLKKAHQEGTEAVNRNKSPKTKNTKIQPKYQKDADYLRKEIAQAQKEHNVKAEQTAREMLQELKQKSSKEVDRWQEGCSNVIDKFKSQKDKLTGRRNQLVKIQKGECTPPAGYNVPTDIQAEVDGLNTKIKKIEKGINYYTERLNNTPENLEQELNKLEKIINKK